MVKCKMISNGPGLVWGMSARTNDQICRVLFAVVTETPQAGVGVVGLVADFHDVHVVHHVACRGREHKLGGPVVGGARLCKDQEAQRCNEIRLCAP